MVRKILSIAILCFGVVMFGLLFITQQKSKLQESQQQKAAKNFIENFQYGYITQIRITGAGLNVDLQKKDDMYWRVVSENDAKADATVIQEMREVLQHAQIHTLLTSHTQDLARYGLDEAQRIHIFLKEQKNILEPERIAADFYLGSESPVPQTFYAQKVDDNRVYLVTGTRDIFVNGDWLLKSDD